MFKYLKGEGNSRLNGQKQIVKQLKNCFKFLFDLSVSKVFSMCTRSFEIDDKK